MASNGEDPIANGPVTKSENNNASVAVDELAAKTDELSIADVVKSALSPMAAEFVPRRIVTQAKAPDVVPDNPYKYSKPHSSSNGRSNNHWNQGCGGAYGDDIKEGDLELDDYFALGELKEFIDQVSSMPHLYDQYINNITDVLNNCIDEDEDIVLQCVANNIVDQAIIDPNFRYNGARLCEHLIQNLSIKTATGSFREELMSRCQREHARRATLVKSGDGSYLRGVTLVIADLSTRLSEDVLYNGLPDLIETLLAHPSAENVKTACLVLKLCGPTLEKKNDRFPQIIANMKDVQGNVSEDIQAVIANVLEYRERGWKAAPLPADFYNPYAEGNIPPEDLGAAFNDGYAGPPEQFFPPSNSYGYGNIGYDFGNVEDEQNEDVIDAFEEFLRASGQK